MLTATDYKKMKARNRRKNTLKKKQEMLNKVNNSLFIYKTNPKNYSYEKVVVPEHTYEALIATLTYCGDIVFKPSTRTIPEHIRLVRSATELPNHSHIKVADVSNRRSFAKRQTNRRVRHIPFTYNEGTWESYITVIDNKPVIRFRSEDSDWDMAVGSSPSDYRKVFEYKWEVI